MILAALISVHAQNEGVEHILVGVRGTAVLGVEVQTACLQYLIHSHGGDIDVTGELVGIPAQQHIALVGIDGAQHAVDGRDAQIVLEGVTCQSCGYCFIPFLPDIQLSPDVVIILHQGAFCLLSSFTGLVQKSGAFLTF